MEGVSSFEKYFFNLDHFSAKQKTPDTKAIAVLGVLSFEILELIVKN